MKVTRFLFAMAFVLVAASAVHAQTQRLLLIGDSWAAQQWSARVFRDALQNAGLGQYVENGTIAVGGSTADQWANNGTYLSNITTQLTNNPTIDVVHMQLGGNDYNAANPSTPAELDTLIESIWDDIDIVIAHILSIRPDARIIWSNYDYTLGGGGEHDGLIRFGEEAVERSSSNPNFFYLNTLGLAHHTFGYPGEFAAGERPLPGGFPGFVPLAGGDLTLPGHSNAWNDSIHYNTAAYLRLAELEVDQYLRFFLTDIPHIQILGLSVVEDGDQLALFLSVPDLTPPLLIQWLRNGTPLGGENGMSFVRDPVGFGDAGTYTVSISNGAKGAVESDSVQVIVLPAGSLPTATWWGLGVLILMGLAVGSRFVLQSKRAS